MKQIRTLMSCVFIVVSLQTMAQNINTPGFRASNFREVEMSCIKNKIEGYYDRIGFEIHSATKSERVFIFPTESKYHWRVWKSIENPDFYVVISLLRNKKGEVKNTKKACVTIDAFNGIIEDKMILAKHQLFPTADELKKLKDKDDNAPKYSSDIMIGQ